MPGSKPPCCIWLLAWTSLTRLQERKTPADELQACFGEALTREPAVPLLIIEGQARVLQRPLLRPPMKRTACRGEALNREACEGIRDSDARPLCKAYDCTPPGEDLLGLRLHISGQ